MRPATHRVFGRTVDRPVLVLVLLVLVGFGAYALLAESVRSPRAFSDELLYFDSAAAIAEGDGLSTRGEDYRVGPIYPVLLSTLLWITPDRETAYELAKLLNALVFPLTAIPVFLLARRLLRPWPSFVAASLSIAIPSSMYVSVVMTESLAYLTFAWALYAIALAVEKPSITRQVIALGVILVAAGVRTQFLVLYAAYLLSVVLATLLLPDRRARPRETAIALWPTLVIASVGAFTLLLPTALESGESPRSLGPYSTLWRTYEFDQLGKWLVYHLANLELYVAVVPLAVAPIVVAAMVRRCRNGSERDAAFLALFATTNLVLLLLAAAFNSTVWSGGILHDRVVFYVVPLWVILLLVWIAEGTPRPFVAAGFGGVLALVLPFTLPFSDFAKDDGRLQFNAVTTTLWAAMDKALATSSVSGQVALSMFVLALVLAALFTPASRSAIVPGLVFAVFLLTAMLSWETASRNATFWHAVLPDSERAWVDDRVPRERQVTLLVVTAPCGGVIARDAFYLTEFFNSSVGRVVRVGAPIDSLPSMKIQVGREGTIVIPSGRPLAADLVVAQPGVRLDGDRVVEGTRARLVLWDVDGTVRARGVSSAGELSSAACRERAEP